MSAENVCELGDPMPIKKFKSEKVTLVGVLVLATGSLFIAFGIPEGGCGGEGYLSEEHRPHDEEMELAARPTRKNLPVKACGNGICSDSETCGTCPIDCGSCDPDGCGEHVDSVFQEIIDANPGSYISGGIPFWNLEYDEGCLVKLVLSCTSPCTAETALTTLPSSIGNLIYLKELQIYNQQIVELPASVAAPANLEILDFRHNQLTELPQSIEDIENLTIFLAGGNKLYCDNGEPDIPEWLNNLCNQLGPGDCFDLDEQNCE